MIILGESLWETFKALSVFFVGIFEVDEALVYLDAGHNAAAGKEANEILAIVSELAGSFVEENNAINVFFEVWRGKEDVAIIATVLLVVWNVHAFELFVNRTTRFVGSKDAFSFCHQELCVVFYF